MSVTLYHNPRCSKSRATLILLEEHGINPDIRLYLEANPSADEISHLLDMLNMNDARSLIRKGEDAYKQLQLANTNLSQAELIKSMVTDPKLIERPIVTYNGQARIGRPPESVLEILDAVSTKT